MEQRFNAVCEAAAKLMRDGVHLYSPIAHTHPIAQFGLPKGWDFWREYDELILSKCDQLWVLMLDGWRESKGVLAETEIAQRLHLSIRYLMP